MSVRYRLVHFLPDPFSGARVPVAALVGGDGRISVAQAMYLPAAACLGSSATEAALGLVLESLGGAKTLDSLPVGAGPQAVLGPVTNVPPGVADAAEWVRQHILPRPLRQTTATEPATKRPTYGSRFFKQWSVDNLVHKRFRPSREWAGLISTPSPGLEPVSHWTGNAQTGVLLMEPIIPARLKHAADIREVFSRFAGYRVFLGAVAMGALERHTQLCVYVLPGGTTDARDAVRTAFNPLQARIVDTEIDRERDEFLTLIRTLGAPGGQSSLPPLPGLN
jgi:hypothetical protein